MCPAVLRFCVACLQIRAAPQYDKDGHQRYHVTVKSRVSGTVINRKVLESDEKFSRILCAEVILSASFPAEKTISSPASLFAGRW